MFRLRSCIASGSSGAVYRADQIALGRTVAVKILRPELALDPRFVSRFHGEALAASRLNHPNTVAVIDYGQTDDGLLYLAMEHLRGRPLSAVVAQEHPLARPRVVDFVAQIAAGVEEAHEAGVIHADLKPENVVVEHRRGGWDLVKVVDFGIARLLGQPRDGEDAQVICGTPEYMAPEVVRGGDPVIGSDVYALGAILYELCVGRPPFVGDTSVEILTAQLRDIPAPFSTHAPAAESLGDLEAIARRALEKDPDDRFASVAALREALLEAATGISAPRTASCPGCGARNEVSFKFCPDCGRARSQPPASPVATDTPTEQMAPPHDIALLFAGRSEARRRVRAFADKTRGALHVAGNPGSGKTRLLRELFAEATSGGCAVYVATPDPTGQRAPHYPIRALLTAVLDLPARCPYDELERIALELGLTPRDVPGLAELLSGRRLLVELDARARQREMSASTRRALAAAAERDRTLYVFEDADRYDDASQRMVAEIVTRAASMSLHIALSTGGESGAGEDAIFESLPCEHIELAPLAEDAVAEIADDVRRRAGVKLPEADVLFARCGGDPAYLHELLRCALEGGSAAEAPEHIADLVSRRLELLPRGALLVAQSIAVFGMEASEDDVAAALGDRLTDGEREEAIAHLEARGLLATTSPLRFERALVRDVVYDRIPAATRRELHAVCLERMNDGAAPAHRGHHLCAAGRDGEAASALAEAGDEAAREVDDRSASDAYQRALACARRAMLAEVDERNRRAFLEISIKLADTLARLRQSDLARGVADEALTHCSDDAGIKARLLRAIGHIHAASGEPASATGLLRQAIGLGIMTGERELLASLYLDLASHQVETGRISEAIFELTEALDLITAGEGSRSASLSPSLWRLALKLALLHGRREEHERALAVAREAERLAKRAGSRLGVARAHAVIASQCEVLGHAARARRYRAKAAEGMRALGDRRSTAELLLAAAKVTSRFRRRDSDRIDEAERLSVEVGADGFAPEPTAAADEGEP